MGAVIAALFAPMAAKAQSFTVSSGTDTTAKTLTGTQTGTVQAGATLSATTAITWTVNGANPSPAPGVTIDNSGSIVGATRGIDTSGSTVPRNITVWNRAGATITGTGNDAFRINGDIGSGAVAVYNYGTILSNGGQALDFDAITSTTGTVNIVNYATGVIQANAADAVRPGEGAVVTNYGLIYSNGVAGDSNDGVDWQAHSGTVINKTGGTISGFRHGITTDANVNVVNETGAIIIGRNGSGVGSDGTGTVTNYGRITGAYNGSGTGDGDGVDIDFAATVVNYGIIEGTGAAGFDSGNRANNSEGLSIGGGSVTNFGTISGASYGIVVNNDSNLDNSRSGVAATTIVNNAGGTIIGQNGFAIRLENKTGTAIDNDTIVNYGTIIGNGAIPDPNAIVLRGDGTPDPGSVGTLNGVTYTGTGSARFIRGDGSAIQIGEGNDVLTNYGTIIGNNGRAVNLEGGNDTLNVMKGSRIVGLVDGGAGSDTLAYNKVGLTDAKRAALQAGQTVNIGGTLYTSFETVTGAAQSFASFANAGTLGLASLFDNLPASATSAGVVNLLDSVASSSNVSLALAQLSPQAYQNLGRITMDTASQTTSAVNQRLTQDRFGRGGNDFSGVGAAMSFADSGLFDRTMTPERMLSSVAGFPDREINALAAAQGGDVADALAYAPATKARPGLPVVTPQADHGVFVTSSLNVTREGARDGAPAFRATTGSVVAGADWRIADQYVVGVFGGYAATRGSLDDFGSTTSIDTKSVGGYGAYYAPTWYATVIGLVGWSDYSNSRVALGAVNGSQFSGDHYVLRGAVGTDLRVGGVVVTPEAGLQYIRVATDAFTETGTAAALGIAADSSESLRSSLGARVAFDTTINGGVVTPEFRAAWLHEFSDGVRGLTASFVDTTLPGSFVTSTASGLRDRGVIGTGVTGRLGALTSVSLNYDAVIGDNAVSHQFSGRLKYSF
ncbi:MAG: autotransporter domain-containing protein [Tardiphaga sp.]